MAVLPPAARPLSSHPVDVGGRTEAIVLAELVLEDHAPVPEPSGLALDAQAVYCPQLHRLYAVPIEVAPRGGGTFRVAPAANNQSRGIRWAADFEVPA
jgi:PD-(D/E)XK endonuclease